MFRRIGTTEVVLAYAGTNEGIDWLANVSTGRTYEQWNVGAGSAGVTGTARDATKTQIFIGGAGGDSCCDG